MAKKSGRPPGAAQGAENKQRILDATIGLIRREGADAVTVRNVCREADVSTGTFYHYFENKDDLLMVFLRELDFEVPPQAPLQKIDRRIGELYSRLIDRYLDLGECFMKRFYTTGNRSLSAYMGEVDGQFAAGTVMACSEKELLAAQEAGVLRRDVSAHTLAADICTIVKGCVFEWCLSDGTMEIREAMERLISGYLHCYFEK